MRYALLSLLLASAFAQTVPPATPADKPKEPTAAQQFKNIQVLKDVPVREWFPTMAFISGSLGVGCDHCHVNPFPKDDKPAKARAREMMRMVQQINAQNFPDQPNRVTCMTCHNGSTKPARAPAVTSGKWFSDYTLASVKAPGTPAAPPDAAAIIAKYRAAIGTKNASIRSRYYKGVVTSYNGSSADAPRSFAQEVYIAGEHVRVEVTGPQGTTITVYDGHQGWVVTPKETHAMDAEDLEQLRNNVLRNLQLDYLPQYTQAAVRGAEELRGIATWAVDLTNPDGRVETFFFEQESGLLVARRSMLPSAFAKFPAETWFMDYRDVDGVQLPMTVVTASVASGIFRTYDDIRLNLSIDPKKFQPPAAGTGTGD